MKDLLGSNFLDDDDHSELHSDCPPHLADRAFCIAGVRPLQSLAVGRERLPLTSLLNPEGLLVHDKYWDEAHRANLLEPVIDLWLPPPASPLPTLDLAQGSAPTFIESSPGSAAPHPEVSTLPRAG